MELRFYYLCVRGRTRGTGIPLQWKSLITYSSTCSIADLRADVDVDDSFFEDSLEC